jgi:anti-sigma B factor antagonist
MSLSILTETLPNKGSVIHLVGKLTQGEDARAFRGALESLESTSPDGLILLDLAGVEYIDSTGIGELVSGFIKAQKQGQHLVLAGLSPKVRDIIKITNLQSVFEVYDSVEAAKKALVTS